MVHGRTRTRGHVCFRTSWGGPLGGGVFWVLSGVLKEKVKRMVKAALVVGIKFIQ